MFLPIYIHFMNPVCDTSTIFVIPSFILFAIAFVAILKSIFKRKIGRQLLRSVIFLSGFGKSVKKPCFF